MVATLFLALALAAPNLPATSLLPLAELPTQQLASGDCALVLWERATGRRVAMLTSRSEGMRVSEAGSVRTLPRISGDAALIVGFSPQARYGDARLQIETSLAIVANDVAGSAIVRDGVIAVTGSDGVQIVAPVAGLAGCGS